MRKFVKTVVIRNDPLPIEQNLRKAGFKDVVDVPFNELYDHALHELKPNWPNLLASIVINVFGSLKQPFNFVVQTPWTCTERVFQALLEVTRMWPTSSIVLISDGTHHYNKEALGASKCKSLYSKVCSLAGNSTCKVHLIEAQPNDLNKTPVMQSMTNTLDSDLSFSVMRVIA